MKFRLSLEYACYPIWEIDEYGLVDTIPTDDLYFSEALKKKIDKITDLFHSLFIDNAIEFAYIGGQHLEVEKEITSLQAEIADEIRAELKDGDELVEVWHFYTAKEMEAEKAISEM